MPTTYYPAEKKKPVSRIRIHNEILTIFAILIVTVSYAQVNLTQGLIGHYPFTGNANDVSGNNINGTISNAVLTTDRDGIANNAYYFNGANSYIQLPYSGLYNFKPQDSFSISVWVLPDPGYSWPAQAVVVKAPPHPDYTLSQWNYGTYILNYKAMSGYAYNNILNGSTTLTPNQCWYNIISTYKNGIWKLYVNGILESTNSSQTRFILQDGTSRIAFGKKGESFGDWYKGKMDDVRIYNRVLNEDEVRTIVGQCQILSNCNNWLRTTNPGDAVKIGDLDISGNQLTVEATFNRVAPYTGGYLYGGDLVSKHDQPADCNYLLRPNNAEISTTNGFFQTPAVCEIELNKTYHVAMTYNGSSLKFYRNGFLLKEIPANGNLIQNNWITTIGDYAPGTPGTPENLNGYINEVRIWNVARSQSEIRTYMNSSLPNPTSQTGLLAYYTFDNLQNKQGNTIWNGTLTGNAAINATNTSCTFIADSCDINTCSFGNDFSFDRDPCTPFTIKYTASAVVRDSITWNLGDGTVLKNSASFSHTYLAPGNYSVSMIRYLGTCSDTVRKTINVSIQNDIQTILTNDTSICLGATKQLLSSPALKYCWSPSTFLSDPGIQNPVTSATQNITYQLTTESIGANIIANGNFSAGNSGFTSQYSYTANNTTEGEYFVGPSPQAWYFAHFPCVDHTTGNGNMLLVNGSPTADVEVWKTTVAVTPNTNYAFSTWISSISNPNPAQLAFTINGIPVGNQINASVPPCNWKQFYSTWNSGNSNSATIAIVNKNTVAFGNDFALDDISFAPVFLKRDSVKIIVDTPSVNVNNDTTVCAGSQIQLTASGGVTYSWTPGSTLSNSTIANPIATPLSSTKYVVTGTTAAGCSAKDSIIITVNPKPIISITNDTLICASTSVQLNASGGTLYSWSPASSLSSSTINNPVASPSVNTTYFVTVTDANNCSNNDSVKVTVRPENQFSISPGESVCLNDSIQLVATGGDLYSWGPVSGLSNTSVSNPMATPENTTVYSVTITDTLCNVSETLSTTVSVLPLPVLALSKSNDIDCSNNRSQLVATGASQYLWAPANSLSNPNINNPFASPLQTTQYFVAGKDLNGCTNTDSITVLVTGDNKGGYLMPNAFTPNNDGLNDCYGISGWGVITELDFSIYNRWGELVFHSTDPLKCWDGTYKGIKQAPAMYTYVVRAKTSCESSVFRKGMFSLIR